MRDVSTCCRVEGEKSEVYHSTDCPVSQQQRVATDNGARDESQDANGNISPSNSSQVRSNGSQVRSNSSLQRVTCPFHGNGSRMCHHSNSSQQKEFS